MLYRQSFTYWPKRARQNLTFTAKHNSLRQNFLVAFPARDQPQDLRDS